MVNKKKLSNRSLTEMPTHFPDIAARFRQFKEETGLTFKDMAATIGVVPETLQAYASGSVSPNFHVLRMLNKKFGLDNDWLIDGKHNKKKAKPLSAKITEMKRLLQEWEGD